jgi:hypothetical protein
MITIDFLGIKGREAQESFIAFLMDNGLNYFLERFYRDNVKVDYVQIEKNEITFKLKEV